jgi:phage tail-like protein
MGLAGTVKSFDKKFKFKVEIDGFKSADFQKASALEVEISNVEHYEGGSVVPNKSPGLVKFTPVTLERGVSKDVDFLDWVTACVALAAAGVGATNTGAPDPLYKRNLDIVQMDRDGAVVKRWTLFGAWPTKYVAGEWDNTASETVIESITLEYDFFDKTL